MNHPTSDRGVNDLASRGEGCLFEEPFSDLPSVQRSSDEIPAFLKRVEASDDHRLVCIMGALVAEHHLDRMLKLMCPKYDVLEGSNDFSFSLRINLLQAWFIVPHWITRDLHVIRAVRNLLVFP
jgi:hypothetical protein